MVLPGTQALFGFQLIAIFNSTFKELSFSWQLVHLIALFFCATAMALTMTPAAYHRMAMRGRLSPRLYATGVLVDRLSHGTVGFGGWFGRGRG